MNTPPPSANISPGPLWALLSPIGRIGREPYWLCFAIIWIIFCIAMRIWWLSEPGTPTPEALLAGDFINTNPLFPVLILVLQWFQLALVIKRLQDVGQSGFLALLIFVPVISLIMLIVLGLVPSQAAPNRHGPLPNSYWRKR
ncbi:DUF805 domain-containing protein [Roseibium sp. AS2]|uniref:DUF805 domain-containing protein n=1 Tax=Roseibium sp. AS2 TaxID=3135781 RepID=UPI003172637F